MKKHFIVIFSILLVSSLLSCSDSERRLPYVSRYATVKIKMTLPDEAVLSHMNIIDRVLRFFSRDAIAQTAPATFSSIRVVVTSSDMDTIDQTFGPAETITLTVSGGLLRRFEVTATVDQSDPSAALSFRGITTLDLVGETVTVPVIMNLHETKIVIPDPAASIPPYTVRLIQINNLAGDIGWIEKTASDIGFSGTFQPWDVDFDNQGKIYIANNFPTDGSCVVIRLDNINDTSCETIGTGSSNAICAIAVDRFRNYLYYATNPIHLKRCNLDGTDDRELATIAGAAIIESITGLDVDAAGMLYISGTTIGNAAAVFLYNPLTETVISYYQTYLNNPSDIMVKSPYIYIANFRGADNYKILQLQLNIAMQMQYTAGYGIQADIVNKNQGYFYGPRRFVGIRNDVLIVIDDHYDYNLDKLVSMQDMSGTGWATYGDEGKSTGQFQFFYAC